MRRNPEENNFKAVLECVRDIMNEGVVLPDFLKDILLGYGDAAAAHYSQLPNALTSLDFCDTFLDEAQCGRIFPREGGVICQGLPPSAAVSVRLCGEQRCRHAVFKRSRRSLPSRYPQSKYRSFHPDASGSRQSVR